ncbi:hypothetical protein LTR66_008394 [Elasticomyces elasticus]|nr:hypothetical protein LTR66_008394 [Elasticomyces elasticus]
MAVFPKLAVDSRTTQPASAADIEAWTVEQAAETLAAVTLSSPALVTGTSVAFEIPLDEYPVRHAADEGIASGSPVKTTEAVHTVYRRREPIRRDSLKRREALLKGKEGSRRRQRWENDRLLSNPHAQPPLPSDWEVRPTYPVHRVPYFLAPLWDADKAARESAARHKTDQAAKSRGTKEEQSAARVAKELRERLKRARGAKGLLMDLEEEVRSFVEKWKAKERQLEKEGLIEPDSEDEEIVFVGRNGAMSDMRQKAKEEQELKRDKLIFQSLVDDNGASFGRWLVHSIATYYGLRTWSVTTGDPALRLAYVGLKDNPKTGRPAPAHARLPQPLWGLV